jgi:hypothetical protein
MNKNQTIELLKTQMPGFYSVEQVINLINGIEEEKSSNKISVEGIEELKITLLGAITSKIDRLHSEDVVDFSSADFSISYNNQVEIDSINVNSDEINEVIEEALTDALHDFFKPEEEEELQTPYANPIFD